MDRDTIIRLAREAGAVFSADGSRHEFETQKTFERFAALVAKHQREQGYRQCAKGQRTTQFCGMVEQAVQDERKRICNMLLDMHAKEERHNYYLFIANIIKESA